MNPGQEVECASARAEETQAALRLRRRHSARVRDAKVQEDVPEHGSQIESKDLELISNFHAYENQETHCDICRTVKQNKKSVSDLDHRLRGWSSAKNRPMYYRNK